MVDYLGARALVAHVYDRAVKDLHSRAKCEEGPLPHKVKDCALPVVERVRTYVDRNGFDFDDVAAEFLNAVENG